MCEAYVYLAKDPRTSPFALKPVPEPMTFKYAGAERGDGHYWLQTSNGGVMDLNFGLGERRDPRYTRYRDGWPPTRVQGFRPWKSDPRYPSNQDARKIMNAVWAKLARDTAAVKAKT